MIVAMTLFGENAIGVSELSVPHLWYPHWSHTFWYSLFYQFSPLFTIGITIVFLLVGLNILALVFSHKHQTLYDMIAGTFVEKTFSL